MKKLKLSVEKHARSLACIVLLTSVSCEPKVDPNPAKVAALVKKTEQQLVFVKGGEFLMGDFGAIHSPEKLPYTRDLDDGPLHKVVLSDFSILANKVTIGDFDVYAAATGVPKSYQSHTPSSGEKRLLHHALSPTFPVGVDWKDAQLYCRWLGAQLGQKMDLPTEAQWEYAARGGGKLLVFPTDNGKDDKGRNFPSHAQVDAILGKFSSEMPVGSYPPNDIGIFDLANNGFEWVRDWYAADYYAKSPSTNPAGPESGKRKVLRSLPNRESYPSTTFERSSRESSIADSTGLTTNRSYCFRCVSHGPF